MTLMLRTATAALIAAAPALAQNPMVGGAPMLEERNIVENAVNSADHNTLVAAVQAAGLVETLSRRGALHGLRADQRRLRGVARGGPSRPFFSPRTRISSPRS